MEWKVRETTEKWKDGMEKQKRKMIKARGRNEDINVNKKGGLEGNGLEGNRREKKGGKGWKGRENQNNGKMERKDKKGRVIVKRGKKMK